MRRAASANAATASGACFSGINLPANTTSGSAGWAVGVSSIPAYSPSSTVGSPRKPSARRRRACSREKQNAFWGRRAHSNCTAYPDRASGAAEVFAPVGAAPHLVPVDDQAVTAERTCRRRGQQREVGKGAGVHHLVAAAVSQQMPQHPQPKHQRRDDPATAVGGVQRQFRPHRHHPHAVDPRLLAPLPLAQRQVGDFMALFGEALGEVSIPALGAPHGAREEAVVYEADAHRVGECHRRSAPDLAELGDPVSKI